MSTWGRCRVRGLLLFGAFQMSRVEAWPSAMWIRLLARHRHGPCTSTFNGHPGSSRAYLGSINKPSLDLGLCKYPKQPPDLRGQRSIYLRGGFG